MQNCSAVVKTNGHVRSQRRAQYMEGFKLGKMDHLKQWTYIISCQQLVTVTLHMHWMVNGKQMMSWIRNFE
jgi:hypothetical protein